jgi:hypothetical protein
MVSFVINSTKITVKVIFLTVAKTLTIEVNIPLQEYQVTYHFLHHKQEQPVDHHILSQYFTNISF